MSTANLPAKRRKEIARLGGLAKAKLPKRVISPEEKELLRLKNCARKNARYALKIGVLTPGNCFCGKPGVMHHNDHSKPMEVTWLCPSHHSQYHWLLRKKAKLAKLLTELTNFYTHS